MGYSPGGCKELDKTENACQKEEVFGKWLKTERGKQFNVQLPSHVQLFANPCTAACQASLSFTISQS